MSPTPCPRARTTLFPELLCLSELSHPLRQSSIPLRPTGLLQLPGVGLTCSEEKPQWLPILMALLQSLWSQTGTSQADFNFSPWNTEFGHKFKTKQQKQANKKPKQNLFSNNVIQLSYKRFNSSDHLKKKFPVNKCRLINKINSTPDSSTRCSGKKAPGSVSQLFKRIIVSNSFFPLYQDQLWQELLFVSSLVPTFIHYM